MTMSIMTLSTIKCLQQCNLLCGNSIWNKNVASMREKHETNSGLLWENQEQTEERIYRTACLTGLYKD